ncbi:hypothetical protein [Shewanella surugensis]|uniref:Uncharacterized protein n=1 Tax=Shewanella surugensis TaxID=212020 RepID=A0ABT0L7Q5_9GAMM|nr:hypothetical protein [Shewanella surugensis]MCL1123201.1 hypothetical protein [Shewanella surugensis]
MEQANIKNVTMKISDKSNNNAVKANSDSAEASATNEDDPSDMKAKIKSLTEQLGGLSKKLSDYACCQQPFTQELGQYLSNNFEDHELRKRP